MACSSGSCGCGISSRLTFGILAAIAVVAALNYFTDGVLYAPAANRSASTPEANTTAVADRSSDRPGVGVQLDENTWFVPASVPGENGFTLETSAGPVKMRRTPAGLVVTSAPDGVRVCQVDYAAWKESFPDTKIINALPARDTSAIP
jgi:hypothetical protein